jgi:hypothetical protein
MYYLHHFAGPDRLSHITFDTIEALKVSDAALVIVVVTNPNYKHI